MDESLLGWSSHVELTADDKLVMKIYISIVEATRGRDRPWEEKTEFAGAQDISNEDVRGISWEWMLWKFFVSEDRVTGDFGLT